MTKTKFLFKNQHYEVCASDRMFSVSRVNKNFGKYTIEPQAVKEWTDSISDSLSKGYLNEVNALCKSFINN